MADLSALPMARRRDKISLGHSHLELQGTVTSQKSESASSISLVAPSRVDVTQAGSVGAAVTADGLCGTITCFTSTAEAQGVAATAPVFFAWTNKHLTATSIVLLTVEYSATATGCPVASMRSLAAGSASIVLSNVGSVALGGVIKIHYLVLSSGADLTVAYP